MPQVARLHAILWGVFSMGGFIAAFLLPVLIYLVGIAYPLGLWPVSGTDPTTTTASSGGYTEAVRSQFISACSSSIVSGSGGVVDDPDGVCTCMMDAIGYLIIIIGILATAVYLLQYNPSFFSLP